MNKSEEVKVNITSRATHRGLEKSTTLNRRYVKRPTKLVITDGTEEIKANIKATSPKIEYHKTRKISIIDDKEIEASQKSSKISHIPATSTKPATPKTVAKPVKKEVPDVPPAPNPYQAAIDARKAKARQQNHNTIREVSSRALKDAAIARALAEMEQKKPVKPSKAELREEKIAAKVMANEMKAEKKKAEKATKHLKKRKGGRILLAFATSAACMIALAAIVKVNLPNISVRVAAVQTGVEAGYPSYIPRDFSLSGVYTNDNNSVIIDFNGPEGKTFSLSEEKSSWDSTALLTNYVKGAYGSDYDIIREQGITIYINYSNAAWVNNGTFYRITAGAGTLTKKQIKNIVGSL